MGETCRGTVERLSYPTLGRSASAADSGSGVSLEAAQGVVVLCSHFRFLGCFIGAIDGQTEMWPAHSFMSI